MGSNIMPVAILLAACAWVVAVGLQNVTLFIQAGIIGLVFVSLRQLYFARRRLAHPIHLDGLSAPLPRPTYFLIVLGSGGHTKEMLAMLEQRQGSFRNVHRRYVISSGDTMSTKHLEAFEKSVSDKHPGSDAGTFDAYIVTRARKIHQPLLTVPFSAFYSILEVLPLLLSRPSVKGRPVSRVPDVIVTNGPATGFFVAAVAHLLKLAYLVPEDALQVLFIESWARIRTLSLTGKLLYYTGMADLFLVQHQAVADKYGVVNAGPLVFGRPTGA